MTGVFENRNILVTGAASGIGRATAHLFADAGARVLAVDISGEVEETAAGHERIIAMRGDAGHEPDVVAMIAATTSFDGGIDVICANAGVSGGSEDLFEQSASDWEALLRVNLIGPFLAIKHGARAMIDAGRGGAIVCTASVAGLRAGAGGPSYSASKAGVINLVQTAAQRLAGTGIRVNAVCPGLVETGMTQAIYERARARHREGLIGQLNPLRRGGSPGEIASAIAFLASDAAGYVNGHALVVDAGLSTSHPFITPQGRGQTTC